MSRAYTKSFSLIVFTLCLCLSFNSIASTFILATHNMTNHGMLASETVAGPSHHKHHVAVISADHHLDESSLGAVENANAGQHTMANNCCDDGKEGCLSTNSACATHCAVSVIDRTGFCLPLVMTTKFVQEAGFRQSISVNLAGPFKPPR